MKKTNIGTSFKIISRPEDLLYILFIITGFYFLLENLPVVIKGFVSAFRSKASGRFELYEYEKPVDWTMAVIKLLLPVVLLIAAKPMANYFAKNVSDEPVLMGDDIEGIDEKETTEP